MKGFGFVLVLVLSFISRGEAKSERVSVREHEGITGWVSQHLQHQVQQGSIACSERSYIIAGVFAGADEIYRDSEASPELVLIKNDGVSKGTVRDVTWVTLTNDKMGIASLVYERQSIQTTYEGSGLEPRKTASKFVSSGPRFTCSSVAK